MTESEMFSIIEGLLFVSNEPITIKNIADIFNKTPVEISDIMRKMIDSYEKNEERGIKIVQTENKYHMVTKQDIFKYITKAHTNVEKPKISSAMIETLAIIAYKQPVTKLDIEGIRGVKSDHIVNKLIEYDLVRELGRSEKIGRPIMFGTSDKFLIGFGLNSIDELPNIEQTVKGEVNIIGDGNKAI